MEYQVTSLNHQCCISQLVDRMAFIYRNIENNVKQPELCKKKLFVIQSNLKSHQKFLLSIAILKLGGQIIPVDLPNDKSTIQKLFGVRIIDWTTIRMIYGLHYFYNHPDLISQGDNDVQDHSISSILDKEGEQMIMNETLSQQLLASVVTILEFLEMNERKDFIDETIQYHKIYTLEDLNRRF